ncbi:MAG: GerMN domain-containing protein [Clostridia bacterium]|nr:GerMN domain-containing protein [Clostridia bacterium]
MLKRCLILMSVLVFLFACNKEDAAYNNGIYKVYFRDSHENKLVEETRLPEEKPTNVTDAAKYVLEEIIAGPQLLENQAVFPEGVRLLSVNISDDNLATVNLSEEIYHLSGTDELFARFSIVNTLCALPDINKVELMVNGEKAVSGQTNKEIGVLSQADIVFSPQTTEVSQTTAITLYFPDEDGRLTTEFREVETQNTLSMEKTVVTELLKGPKMSSLTTAIPAETKLLSLEISDMVCFVNFSEDFVSKFVGGSTSAIAAVFSVVNSLTELETVDSVQFLIEGRRGVEFGGFVFDEPIVRNEGLIPKR